MSGHSKWSQIKRQKGVADARRGQVFTKLAREITVATRKGGSDPDANFRLRLAIQKAREQNMPADNIERAIKRGTGDAEGAALIEAIFEGYGPGGTAILTEIVTDNRNRTIADIRNIFTRGGGNLGEAGCVAWLFETKGMIIATVEKDQAEALAMVAIDAGADDVKLEGDSLEIYTAPEQLEEVRRVLEKQSIKVDSAEISMVPKSTVTLAEKEAEQTIRLLERLEELDEVQRVYSNGDFPDAVLERLAARA